MNRLVFLALAISVSAHAVQSERFATGEESNALSRLMPAESGIYRFDKDAYIKPEAELINNIVLKDPEDRYMSFSKGEPVAVERLADGRYAISIVLPDSEKGVMPEKIFVSQDEFDKAKLTRTDDGDFDKLSKNFEAYDGAYNEAFFGGRVGRGRASYNHGRQRGCVAYVCQRVGCSGTTGGGVGMTSYLRRKGWRSVSCANAPNGAVASWSGGPRGSGHTAIKSGGGWCYDLGCHPPGRGYGGMNCVAR